MGSDRTALLRGALAGALAAGVWAAQQPLDKRVFGVDYDDAELLGTVITRRRGAPESFAIGTAMHLTNGAVFGAAYSLVAPSLTGRGRFAGVLGGAAAGLAEHLATWPLTRFVSRHPIGRQLPQLYGNHRAFAQATWRHLLFGAILGELDRRLNPPAGEAAPAGEDRAASNGHGNVEHLLTARSV
jgi:hypothetical protein